MFEHKRNGQQFCSPRNATGCLWPDLAAGGKFTNFARQKGKIWIFQIK